MDVICLGILVADVFTSPMDSLPCEGELKTIERFLSSVGGCAANTAVDLRRLDRSVAILGKVGSDMFGDFVVAELRRHGIDTSHVKRSPELPTSGTVILNVCGADRRYIHCIGANAGFSLADVNTAVLAGARILYVGGYLAMPGFSARDLTALFQEARKHSLTTVLDVVIPAGVSVTLEQIAEVLPYTDYLLPNQDEARALTGLQEPNAQARRLAELNPDCTVVITRGRLGSITKCRDALIDTPAFQVDSVDESGAGDAFAAGFITGLLENWRLDYILQFASVVGASCTRALGCHYGVFRFDEALRVLDEQRPLDRTYRVR